MRTAKIWPYLRLAKNGCVALSVLTSEKAGPWSLVTIMLSNTVNYTVNQRLTRMTSFRAPVTRSFGFARLCDLCDLAYSLLWMKADGKVMARKCGEKSHRKASVHVHCEWTKQEKIAAIDLGSFLGYLNSKYCMGLAFCTERHERSSALALRWKLMPMPCSLLFFASFD